MSARNIAFGQQVTHISHSCHSPPVVYHGLYNVKPPLLRKASHASMASDWLALHCMFKILWNKKVCWTYGIVYLFRELTMLIEFWAKSSITRIGSTGIIIGIGLANQKRRYNVMSSLIAWAQTQNDPWIHGDVRREDFAMAHGPNGVQMRYVWLSWSPCLRETFSIPLQCHVHRLATVKLSSCTVLDIQT